MMFSKLFSKLGIINKNQRGMTLVELMLVFTITGIISSSVTMTFFQVVTGSVRANNHMTAISQVQSAGYWISHDAQLAQDVVFTPPTGFPLILSWTGWDDKKHEVTYSLEDMAGGLKELQQSIVVDDEDAVETVVARFIDPNETNVGPDETAEGAIILQVSVTVGGGQQAQLETRVYRIVPRPGS